MPQEGPRVSPQGIATAAHSQAFAALRDCIVDELGDVDRRRLAALLSAMNDAQPEMSPALVETLRAIVALDSAGSQPIVGVVWPLSQ